MVFRYKAKTSASKPFKAAREYRGLLLRLNHWGCAARHPVGRAGLWHRLTVSWLDSFCEWQTAACLYCVPWQVAASENYGERPVNTMGNFYENPSYFPKHMHTLPAAPSPLLCPTAPSRPAQLTLPGVIPIPETDSGCLVKTDIYVNMKCISLYKLQFCYCLIFHHHKIHKTLLQKTARNS